MKTARCILLLLKMSDELVSLATFGEEGGSLDGEPGIGRLLRVLLCCGDVLSLGVVFRKFVFLRS